MVCPTLGSRTAKEQNRTAVCLCIWPGAMLWSVCVCVCVCVVGCEYGDREPDSCSTQSRAQCYNATTRRHCCDTCQRLRDHSAPPGTALTRTPRVMGHVGHGSATQHPQVRHLHELHRSWVTWVMGQPLSTPRYSTYTNSTGHGSRGSWVSHSAPQSDAALTRTPRVMGHVGHGSTTQHFQMRHLHELHGSWVTWVMGQPLSTPIRCGTYTNSTGHGSSESWVNNSALPDAAVTRTPRVMGHVGHGQRI